MLNELIVDHWDSLVQGCSATTYTNPIKILVTFNSSTVLTLPLVSASFEVAVRMLY